MNNIFDKIYVITTSKNINKQQHIYSILHDKLNLNFEFIYSIDMKNLQFMINYNNMNFSYDNPKDTIDYKYGHIGCSFTHHTAISNAYWHNYNNVLIIEDDAKFINDINYIEYVLNNIPEDADFIRYGLTYRENINNFEDINSIYISNNVGTAGTQCYAICNRKTMKKWLDYMNNKFVEVDDMCLWNLGKTYQLKRLICIDPNADIKNKLITDIYE